MEDYLQKLFQAKKKIMVIGDVMIDRYVFGEVNRISPEAPCPILDFSHVEHRLGGASNVAANLAAMNQNVTLVSVIGRDEYSEVLESLLSEQQVDTCFIEKDSNRCTTVKTRIISENCQMFRIDREVRCDISYKLEEKLIQKIRRVIDKMDIVLLSDYKKGVLTSSLTKVVIELANQYNVKVLVDLKSGDARMYRGAYLLKPNKQELKSITKCNVNTEEEIQNAMKELKKEVGCSCVLTTRGSEGMTLLTKEEQFINIKAINKQVYDVIGAGDTAFAYVALGLVNQLSDANMLMVANAAASLKVSKLGTGVVTLEEVEYELKKLQKRKTKIVTINELLLALNNKRNKEIVFTNGCFDILHTGHIQCLQKAKEMGDILIVAVNSNSSVKRIKGENRPLNHEQERMKLLEALECTDYIIKFDEDTPYELIKSIRPNIIVKGNDYKLEEVVGLDIVKEYGGKVVLVNLVEGKSTTNIIKLAASSSIRNEYRKDIFYGEKDSNQAI